MVPNIYLDNAATTKVDLKVSKVVDAFSLKEYANPSSIHSFGKNVKKEVDFARKKIANFIGATPSEIIFTSGGTESNNLAIRGLAAANPSKKHIITSVIEHPSVLDTCRSLEKNNYEIECIKVDSNGLINPLEIEKKIRKDTLLVSVMHVNNEIGTIQSIEEIGKICKKKNVYFHSDTIQSFKKIDINVLNMNLDLISVSGHKIHGPKGIGFLYIKKGTKIFSILTGGGQEGGLRSGTENVPGIMGLSTALDIKNNKENILKKRNKLLKGLRKIKAIKINGDMDKRIYNNINISFYGIEAEGLIDLLDKEGIYVSTGSACVSTSLSGSYVLKEIGLDEKYINGSLRLTLSDISHSEIDYVIDKISKNVEKLRSISPFRLNPL
tara:strand:+ start:10081 stop:11226 length:1146 start_codon:yes stop_codon:yes gene_type:complete